MEQRPLQFASFPPQEPILGVHPQVSPGSDLRLRPTPNSETQELYDKMKRIERELDLDERIRLQGGHGSDNGHLDFLEPPTPSQATTMSRSSSLRSRTHSVTYSNAPVDIADIVEQEERAGLARRRAVRRGPLDKYTKARAALLRKLGACDSCRERKVKCTHHDLSEFDRNYSRFGQPTATMPQLQQPVSPSAHHNYHISPLQQHPPPLFNNQAVLHIGGHIVSNSTSVDGPADELEHMLREMAADLTQPPTASPAPVYETPRRLETIPAITDFLPPSYVPNVTARNKFDQPGSVDEPSDHYLPICRHVDGVWECQWSDGTDASECDSEAEVCGVRSQDLSLLQAHFQTMHAPFREAKPPFFWICSQCRLKWLEDAETCPQQDCSGHQTFERWNFGHVDNLPVRSSPSSIQLPSHGASPMKPPAVAGGPSQIGPFGSSQFWGNGSMNWTGWPWGDNGQQFRARKGGSWSGNTHSQRLDEQNLVPYLRSHGLSQSADNVVSFGLQHPLLACFLALYILHLVWAEGYGVWRDLSIPALQAMLPAFRAICRHIQLWSLVCIAIGLVGTLLYKHAVVRFNRSPHVTPQQERYYLRGFLGSSRVGAYPTELDSHDLIAQKPGISAIG